MGTKADFYIGSMSGKLDWIGSVFKNGDIWHIPTDIIIQVNKAMFEEMVIEYLEDSDSVIRDNHDKWDHPWEDSLCTDYSYIFDTDREKVLMFQMGVPYVCDPVKIKQGRSIAESIEVYGFPSFPCMIEGAPPIDTESLLQEHGYGKKIYLEAKF